MLYVGEIRTFAFDPRQTTHVEKLMKVGWLPCDGRVLPKAGYADLFDAIGFGWGGGDPDSFCVPDLSGVFLRGVGLSPRHKDPDATMREHARSDMPIKGARYNHVASVQSDSIRAHAHTFGGAFQITGESAGDSGSKHRHGDRVAGATNSEGGTESRPKNASVLWFVFSGVPMPIVSAQDLPSPSEGPDGAPQLP